MKISYDNIPEWIELTIDREIDGILSNWLIITKNIDKSKNKLHWPGFRLVDINWNIISQYDNIIYDFFNPDSVLIWINQIVWTTSISAEVFDYSGKIIKKLDLKENEEYIKYNYDFNITWHQIYETCTEVEILVLNNHQKPLTKWTTLKSYNIKTWEEFTQDIGWLFWGHLIDWKLLLSWHQNDFIVVYDQQLKRIELPLSIQFINEDIVSLPDKLTWKIWFRNMYNDTDKSEWYDRIWQFSEGKVLVYNKGKLFVINKKEEILFNIPIDKVWLNKNNINEVREYLSDLQLWKNSVFYNWELFFEWKFYDIGWNIVRELQIPLNMLSDIDNIIYLKDNKDWIIRCGTTSSNRNNIPDEIMFNEKGSYILNSSNFPDINNKNFSMSSNWYLVRTFFDPLNLSQLPDNKYYSNNRLFADIQKLNENLIKLTWSNETKQFYLKDKDSFDSMRTTKELYIKSLECIDSGNNIIIKWKKFKKNLIKI